MTETTTTAQLLESALADLPAKMRVHELAKRAGITSKQVLAALAAQGQPAASAASSVTAAAATTLLTTLLSPPGDVPAGDAPPPVAVELSGADEQPVAGPAVEVTGHTAEQAAAVGGTDEPVAAVPAAEQASGDTALLFLAPESAPAAKKPPARRRRSTKAAAPIEEAPALDSVDEPVVERSLVEGTVDEAPTPAEPATVADAEEPSEGRGNGRRRRGRSGSRGRSGGADKAVAELEEAAAPVEDAAATSQPVDAEIEDDQSSTGGADDESAADQSGTDESGSDEAEDSSESEQAGRRRRRRGRRGRGRVSDGDDSEESDSAESDARDSEAGELPLVGDEAVAAAVTDDNEEADSEGDDEDGISSGNRRRRRRRRRTPGEDPARDDDPDNTVVHVRESRAATTAGSSGGRDTGSSGGTAAGSSSNEVQGVRGSTRLEAKRQRRRDTRDSRRRPQILTEAEFLARRESVERVMAVRQRGELAQVALLEDGILVEHFVSRAGSQSLMGNIYLGKVQNVLPSMEAAFVDIGRGRNAVLYAGEVNWDAAGLAGKARRIETALSSGDTLLVQVSKDPIGHKGARLTTQISLPGRFVVYVPGGGATGISRKLPDTERKRLKSIMDRIVPDDAGVIIRTAAEGVAEEELARDVERLTAQWAEISQAAEKKTGAPLQLSSEPDTLIKVVRDLFNSDITRLVLDGEGVYESVAGYIDSVAPELSNRVSRFERPVGSAPQTDVFSAYRIDEQIAKALERKVHLPSGGSLVIDRTEAMTVVDVNTGKYTGSGGNLEETVTKNNLEAAEEIVRQLRLRDIGGIIVVDFIDMVLESNRELVLRRLTECLGRDRTRHQVAEVTSLGLVQMTRKKMGTGLVEAFSEPCPHCGGRGIVLHDAPIDQAAPDSTGDDDRRSGRNRRPARKPEVVEAPIWEAPRVVAPTTRPPDPRGPKPPVLTAAQREAEAAADNSMVAEALATPLGEDGGREPILLDGALEAGLVPEPAEESSAPLSESPIPTAPDGPQLSEPPVTGSSAFPLSADALDAVAAVRAALDALPAGDAVVVDSAADPVEPTVIETPAPGANGRRRGRRSAGRPAGAPATATAPEVLVLPAVAAEPAAPAAESNGRAKAAENGHTGKSEAPPVTAPDAPSSSGGNRPRRRRAASRPAGPAGQSVGAE